MNRFGHFMFIFVITSKILCDIPYDILIKTSDEFELTDEEKQYSVPMKFKDEDYLCYFPSDNDLAEFEMGKLEEESTPEFSDPSHEELMDNTYEKTMRKYLNKKCFYLRTSGWWSYEICFGGEKCGLRQFHANNENQNENVKVNLGIGTKYFDDFTKNLKIINIHQRYLEFIYLNGEICDLTKKPRTAKIRLFCPSPSFAAKMGSQMMLYSVNEPSTCAYVALFAFQPLCKLFGFKKTTKEKSGTIKCEKIITKDTVEIDDIEYELADLQDLQENINIDVMKEDPKYDDIFNQISEISEMDITYEEKVMLVNGIMDEYWENTLKEIEGLEDSKLKDILETQRMVRKEIIDKYLKDVFGHENHLKDEKDSESMDKSKSNAPKNEHDLHVNDEL